MSKQQTQSLVDEIPLDHPQAILCELQSILDPLHHLVAHYDDLETEEGKRLCKTVALYLRHAEAVIDQGLMEY
jgi:hypothetical protein